MSVVGRFAERVLVDRAGSYRESLDLIVRGQPVKPSHQGVHQVAMKTDPSYGNYFNQYAAAVESGQPTEKREEALVTQTLRLIVT